jgi:glutamine cyclotransferase
LTWKENAVFKLDPVSLDLLEVLFVPGEGWGLATDGEKLYRSDGSNVVKIHDFARFKTLGTLSVTDGGKPLGALNELEWDPLTRTLWANVYETTLIVNIDPQTGAALYFVDLIDIVPPSRAFLPPGSVLNGIALDAEGAMFVTGKNWPTLSRVSFTAP